MTTLTPKIVVVTGGTAGVGRATVRAFARAGADVAILARGEKRLKETGDEVRSLGRRSLAVPTDVADPDAVEHAAAEIERTLGPIDCWVNNAMASVFSPIASVTPQEFLRVTQVTYLGVVHGTQAALRRMTERDRGVILNVGSALAYRGIPLQAAYCASKHAVVGFTDSLRAEILHDGLNIRVTMVHLPAMNTPQFDWVRSRLEHRARPVPPIYEPEVAARAIVWASQHNRREIAVGMPTFKTIWGNRLAPRYVDHVLARQGYASQQTDEPERPDRPDNLWSPAPGEYAARGRFEDRSRVRGRWSGVTAPVIAFAVLLFVLMVAADAGAVWAALHWIRTAST